jgi:hypothetical protein
MSDTAAARELPAEQQRQLATDLFNLVWELLALAGRTVEEDDRMLHAAHASRYHWGQAGPPMHHARRCADIVAANDVPPWLVASGHEALARAHAVAGEPDEARRQRDLAHTALRDVADPEEREVVEADLAGIPL